MNELMGAIGLVIAICFAFVLCYSGYRLALWLSRERGRKPMAYYADYWRATRK